MKSGLRPRRGVGADKKVVMKACVYILKDKNSHLYIGSTCNLGRRIIQHKNGHTQTTKNMNNPALVFAQEYESLEYAREIERRLKKLKRRDYIEKIIKEGYVKMTV